MRSYQILDDQKSANMIYCIICNKMKMSEL